MLVSQVYEGAGEKRRELGTFCGTTVPNKFRSSSSVIVVHFSTDSSRNGKGFVAGYSYAEGKPNRFHLLEIDFSFNITY